MYHGKPVEHWLHIRNEGINDVLEWYGMDVEFEQMDDRTVIAVVSADEVSIEYWLKRYEEYIVKENNQGPTDADS